MRSRREFLQYTVAGLSSAVLARSVSAANPTPSTTDGPFYPTSSMRFSDDDSDLVRISDEVVDAGGEIVLLVGRVTDQASAPIEAARVEIWQCDVNGRYLHSGDRGGKARDA
ncbi:MAG: protocatechuate 3,4-dioxygenase, partial [Chromatiales bacterium]|nr:protocatechuate 3,4-dioxygenase [Chromatiales bacterium]